MRTAKKHPLELSKRKKEILEWIQRGKTSWEIGKVLGIKECTVKAHIAEIFEQLDVTKRSQAVSMAIALGYLSPVANFREDASLVNDNGPRAIDNRSVSIYAPSYFMELLEKEMQRAARYGRCFSLLILEATMSTNNIGEKIPLQKIASVLKNSIRSIDIVGRIDDGKLAILAPELKKANAAAFADKLTRTCNGHACVKIGVVTYPDDGSSPDVLINMAENLFHKARTREGNIYVS